MVARLSRGTRINNLVPESHSEPGWYGGLETARNVNKWSPVDSAYKPQVTVMVTTSE